MFLANSLLLKLGKCPAILKSQPKQHNLVPRSSQFKVLQSGNFTALLTSFFTYYKYLPYLVDNSWLWWIMREVLANQNREIMREVLANQKWRIILMNNNSNYYWLCSHHSLCSECPSGSFYRVYVRKSLSKHHFYFIVNGPLSRKTGLSVLTTCFEINFIFDLYTLFSLFLLSFNTESFLALLWFDHILARIVSEKGCGPYLSCFDPLGDST